MLEDDYDKARVQFEDVYRTIRAFEYWFGPYPFYEDGYKLVQVPYLGMEHQSSVTYGNKFMKGYLGTDLSSSGWGLKWDFIIVHESAHEWWANNVTYKDMADMWIHESFANYAESLFIDYYYGKQGSRRVCHWCPLAKSRIIYRSLASTTSTGRIRGYVLQRRQHAAYAYVLG